ncbi:MAG: PH domain-containing protein [Nitriliruptorales bacterium]|nr:PH domain-containing protein [Nitriliruptorales bacterium]
MDPRVDADATVAQPVLGRIGSWHSHRWLSPLFGVVCWMAIPWSQVNDAALEGAITLNVVVGLAWAIPTWRMGVIVSDRGVRLTGVLLTQRINWDEIESARIARIGIEPRLRIDLVDGEQVWAPGFTIPHAQASSLQDGWRSTEMFRAAQLITAEAERRREEQPPDGIIVPMPAPRPGVATIAA